LVTRPRSTCCQCTTPVSSGTCLLQSLPS
jgi:hypothetical protein